MFFSVIRTIMAGGQVDIPTVAAQVLAIILSLIHI